MGFLDLFRPRWKHSDRMVREAAVKEITDQSVLARIAKNDESAWIRMLAANKLTDESVLIKIAANDRDLSVRNAAVANARLVDQGFLAAIALNKNCEYSIRVDAIKKVANQALLTILAKDDDEWGIRMVAVANSNLTDQSVLAHVAKNDSMDEVRIAATNNPNLTDQRILGDLSTPSAIKKLTDQKILAKIAKTDKYEHIRMQAINRLTDENILADIAKTDKVLAHRNAAIKKITNPKVLEGITEVRENQSVLVEVVKNDKDSGERERAAKKITDQKLLAAVAFCDKDVRVRLAAVENPNLTDQALLTSVARGLQMPSLNSFGKYSSNGNSVEIAAIKKITDQSRLAEIAIDQTYNTNYKTKYSDALSGMKQEYMPAWVNYKFEAAAIRSAAINRVTDRAVLTEIARNDEVESVRKLATERLAKLTGK